MTYKNIDTRREYRRNWQSKNRESVNDTRKKLRNRNRMIINAFKDKECADCGQWFPPCVMDFDHVKGEKVKAVSRMLNGMSSVDNLLIEIMKCDVVCSNCHRIRTHERTTTND